MESPVKSNRLGIKLALLGWFLLAGVTLALEIAYLPINIDQLFTNWQVLQVFPVLEGLVSFSLLSGLILALRYLVTTLFWVVGLVVFIFVGWRKSPFAGIGLLSSAMLVSMSLLFANLFGDFTELPASLGSFLTVAGQMMPLIAVVLFVLFNFLFQDGRFVTRWMRWIALVLGVVLVAVILFILIGKPEGEWVWVLLTFTLLAGFLAGLGSQVYRYFRLDDTGQKNQVRLVVVALVLVPLFLVIPFFLGSSAWEGLLNIFGTLIAPVLLPLALLWAMFRHGLWGIDLDARRKRQVVALAASLVLACMLGLGVVYQANAPEAAQAIVYEPLPASDHPRPVIVDTDMAPDDWMAILFLLQRPDIDIKAMTVAGTGEVHCAPGVRNALRLAALAGESGIPAACGRETPLAGSQVFPEDWRTRADSLNGLDIPDVEEPPSGDAVEMLITNIKDSPQPVTLLALGPLTNLAEAIQADPTILENIEQIYVMGGALEVLGNVSYAGIDNQVAEWNIFIDPLALRQVLESGAPVTLVPLDATNHVPVDLDFYFQLQANHHTPEAQFVYDMLSAQFDFIASGGYFFWDPLAAAILIDESLGYIKEGNIMVNDQPGTSYGLTRLMNSGLPARFAKSADADRFKHEFLRALNQP